MKTRIGMIEREYAEVSVIIPCYRCQDTIERAVASIASQTLCPAEVILVDDCSGDGALEILKEIQGSYLEGWIKIIALRINKGPGSARNRGWEIAKQPYIAFLDSDDAWHPQKIEIQWNWMCAHPDVALTGHACKILSYSPKAHSQAIINKKIRFRSVSKLKLLLSNKFTTPSVMLKKELPYSFVEGKRASEDYLLWCEIVLGDQLCFYCDLPLTFLFKPEYGASGLSSDLLAMEKGELDNYVRLHQGGKISLPSLALLSVISVIKYFKRYIITAIKSTQV